MFQYTIVMYMILELIVRLNIYICMSIINQFYYILWNPILVDFKKLFASQ